VRRHDRIAWQVRQYNPATGESRCLPFNPLAGEVPKEGVHWQKGPKFGKPTAADAYQLPRTYRLSVGLRF
jgi:hypothetical protein